jgi:hypothetical protein
MEIFESDLDVENSTGQTIYELEPLEGRPKGSQINEAAKNENVVRRRESHLRDDSDA